MTARLSAGTNPLTLVPSSSPANRSPSGALDRLSARPANPRLPAASVARAGKDRERSLHPGFAVPRDRAVERVGPRPRLERDLRGLAGGERGLDVELVDHEVVVE